MQCLINLSTRTSRLTTRVTILSNLHSHIYWNWNIWNQDYKFLELVSRLLDAERQIASTFNHYLCEVRGEILLFYFFLSLPNCTCIKSLRLPCRNFKCDPLHRRNFLHRFSTFPSNKGKELLTIMFFHGMHRMWEESIFGISCYIQWTEIACIMERKTKRTKKLIISNLLFVSMAFEERAEFRFWEVFRRNVKAIWSWFGMSSPSQELICPRRHGKKAFQWIIKRDILPFYSVDVFISMRIFSFLLCFLLDHEARMGTSSNKFPHVLIFQLLCHDPAPCQTILIASLFGSMGNVFESSRISFWMSIEKSFWMRIKGLWVMSATVKFSSGWQNEPEWRIQRGRLRISCWMKSIWNKILIIRVVNLSFLKCLTIASSSTEKD